MDPARIYAIVILRPMFVEKACKVFIGCAYVVTAETEFGCMVFDGTWLLCWNKVSVLVDDIRSLMLIWMLINAVLMDVPPCYLGLTRMTR